MQSTYQTTPNHEFQPPFVLALDVGTSSTRALLFDATGAVVPKVLSQRIYQLNTSNAGEVSVDADALLSVVALTIDDVLAQAGPLARQIGAVAIDTFWHSLMGVDAANHPTTPLITWEDTRPFEAAKELRSQLDEKTVHDRTGTRFHASYWPAKLRWLAQHQPDRVKHTAQWISFGEYLHRKLLGHSVCSLSMASGTGMLTTHKSTWDSELMDLLQVRPEQLPELGDLRDSLKGLTPEYATAWPSLRNIPWFPAVGDGAAACIGSGCADIANWSLTIGTSSALRVIVAPELVTPPMGLWLYLVDAKRAVIGGALSEGGNLLTWLDTVLKLPSLPESETLVAGLPPDGHGLTLLPFISGERSLGWHAEARMTINGLSIHTTPADLLRAGMEALAYQLGAVYEQLRDVLQIGQTIPKVICSGGALLGSPTLQHIITDTLGVPLYPSRNHEASARGAALLALEALGILPDVAQAPPDLAHPTTPNPKHGAIYQQAAQRQQSLYRALLGD